MFKFICFNILFLFTIVIKAGNVEVENKKKYALEPVQEVCFFCKKAITTTLTESIDCCAFALCCLSLGIPYIIVQNCRGKGFHVCKGKHTCPQCKKIVGIYDPL